MTIDNSIPLPVSRQVNSSQERAYFEQFASWDTADYFAESAAAWLRQCDVMPLSVFPDSDTTCSVLLHSHAWQDLSDQPSDNSIFVIVDRDYIGAASEFVEVFIWHIAEVALFYAQGGE